ncbi:hypothetical protein [Mesorhizobium sp. P5_C1]
MTMMLDLLGDRGEKAAPVSPAAAAPGIEITNLSAAKLRQYSACA